MIGAPCRRACRGRGQGRWPAGRLAVVMTLVVLLPGCAPDGAELFPGPERSAAALSDDEVRAIAGILRLEDTRTFDAAAFQRLLGHPSLEVRRRAVTGAGRIGDPAAAPFLARALTEQRSAAVRADAAFALGELGDTSDVVIRALGDAIPLAWAPVRPEETTATVEIVAALGKLGTAETGRLVAEALRRSYPGTGPHSRLIAAEALLAAWKAPRPETRISSIVPFLRVPDPELRWRAAYALMRMGVAEAVPRLQPLLREPDEHRVRAYAARGLVASRVDSTTVGDSAVAALTRALEDPHPHVRINALGALGTYDRVPVAPLAARLHDEDANTAIAAAAALGAMGPRAAAALSSAVEDPTLSMAIRGAALSQLARLDRDAALDIVEQWAGGDLMARYHAARALATLRAEGSDAPRVEALVGRLAADADERVAIAAVGDTTRAGGVVEQAGTSTGTPMTARDDAFYQDIVRRYIARPMAGGERPRAVIRTSTGGAGTGEIVLELRPEEAPLTVANFVELAAAGYYDDGVWHRVVPNFVLQDGAPGGHSSGGPGWAIRDEINRLRYTRGTLGMALSGPDTGGSQWFITHSPQPHLDGGYTVFGRVVDGMDVADAVTQGDVIESIRIRW